MFGFIWSSGLMNSGIRVGTESDRSGYRVVQGRVGLVQGPKGFDPEAVTLPLDNTALREHRNQEYVYDPLRFWLIPCAVGRDTTG